jgi:hypothetical protein
VRKLVRLQPAMGIPVQVMTDRTCCENILAVLE